MRKGLPAVGDGAEICDGDLVRLARDGDPVAFRLLVERHQQPVRARAVGLGADSGDVDDIMQETFLRAFLALDRLRDPDRFAAWLSGITANVCRGRRHRDQAMLVPDWPEPLHPAASDGLPSADDLDRADALRAAMASLPTGQRRAVAQHYYADLPAPTGAARVSLHKARRRLRAYLTQHRPDLVPAVSRRPQMTTVRIARTELYSRRGPLGPAAPEHTGARRALTHVVVLEDDIAGRELPLWLRPFDGNRLERLSGNEHGEAGAGQHHMADDLAGQLLHAIGAAVTGVDIGELGPEVIAARITVTGPAGARRVTARLADGLAVAITTGAPVRVADAVMDRLAVRAGTTMPDPGPPSPRSARPHRAGTAGRPRYEPRNLAFAGGLDGWRFGGSFTEHASASHWHDYTCTAGNGTAVIASAVPEPTGFAFLGQDVYADDYRGATVVFRAQVRVTADGPDRAGLFLRASPGRLGPYRWEPLTEQAVLADPGNTFAQVPASSEWASHEVAAEIPGGCDIFLFGIFLAGPGRIEVRNPELLRRT
jgi:DNA-directed RNA polymerase specialized sigma24 family protein/bifunctional DNase/RNase